MRAKILTPEMKERIIQEVIEREVGGRTGGGFRINLPQFKIRIPRW